MKIVCGDYRQKLQSSAPEDRAVSSVAADINRLLSPKSYEELETLEVQIRRKLDSNDPIDTDYWEQLLRSLTVWKARAKLKRVFQAVIDGRVQVLRKQQREEAEAVRCKLAPLAPYATASHPNGPVSVLQNIVDASGGDPEPLLQVRPQDRNLEILDEETFLGQLVWICQPLDCLSCPS